MARRMILAATVVLVGCDHPRGEVKDGRYSHLLYHYSVEPGPGAELMPAAWRLDSFFKKGDTWKEKRLPGYEAFYVLDEDGDGKPDLAVTEPKYDLRFVHKQHSGVITIKSFPIPKEASEIDLRVLMQRDIDGLAGVEYLESSVSIASSYNVTWFRGFSTGTSIVASTTEGKATRHAAEVLEQGETTLAGRPAYFVTATVANMDQVLLRPEKRELKVRMGMMRPPFEYIPEMYAQSDEETRKRWRFPVLVFVSYSSMPEDFDHGLPDFNNLLSRIVIHKDGTVAVRAPGL